MKHLGFPDPAPQLTQSALPLGTHIKEIDLIMVTIFTNADSISGCAVPLGGGRSPAEVSQMMMYPHGVEMHTLGVLPPVHPVWGDPWHFILTIFTTFSVEIKIFFS